VPPVGGDVGAQGIEGAFDSVKDVHAALRNGNSYLLSRNIMSSELGAGSLDLGNSGHPPSS
jgi:hypothetical protein